MRPATELLSDRDTDWGHRGLGWNLLFSILAHGALLWGLRDLPVSSPAMESTGSVIDILLVRNINVTEPAVDGQTLPVPEESRAAIDPAPDATGADAAIVPAPVAAPKAVTDRPRFQPRAPAPRRHAEVSRDKPKQAPASQSTPAPVSRPVTADALLPDIIPVFSPQPEYPRVARRLGLEGEVLLHVLMASNGIPEDVVVVSSSGHRVLDKAAVSAIRSWRFKLNRTGGDLPEPPWIDIPIRFQLN
jgi:protein TonB